MRNPKTIKELYEKLLQMSDLHSNEDDMFDELYSLGKKGNILVLKQYLFGMLGDGVFYMSEPDKYHFDKNKKWHWGKLTYLEQK